MSNAIDGPGKVYRNLIKGLDVIGYPYVVNRSLASTIRVWVHDDVNALRYVVKSPSKAVVGPNLFTMPSDIPHDLDLSGVLYVHPSKWTIDLWKTAGFGACDLAVWPVGIDLAEFRPSHSWQKRTELLVYHKHRPEDQLKRILTSLDDASLAYRLIRYGDYVERDYIAALERAALVIWHGSHESQGIALEEALAMDVPVLLCDVTRLSQTVGGNFPLALDTVPVTSAPYFDATCGRRTYSFDDIGALAAQMLQERQLFSPRLYVEANLSLAGQARRFVALWEYFGLTFEEGMREMRMSTGPWREPIKARSRKLIGAARRRLWG